MKKLQPAVEKYLESKSDNDMKVLYDLLKKYTSYTISRNYTDIDEAESEIDEVIVIALKTYDQSKNILFKTYFWRCWNNFKGTQNIRKNAKKRIGSKNTISMNQRIKEENGEKEIGENIKCKRKDIENKVNEIDFYNVVEKIKDVKDQKIITLLYQGYSQSEIATIMNLTTAAICLRLKRISKKDYADELYETLRG